MSDPSLVSALIGRRQFLRGSAALAAGAHVMTPGAWGSLQASKVSKRRPTLVLIFLRGGCDGLHLVVPYGDPDYARRRRGLAVPGPDQPGGVLAIDETFGLHPAAGALAPLFQRGLAAAVHAVGHPENTRSHFEEQDRWELASPSDEIGAAGWLGRYLKATAEGAPGPIRAVALGQAVPRSLRGPVSTLAIHRLAELRVLGEAKGLDATMAALRRAYGKNRDREAASGGGKQGAEKSRARELLRRDGEATLDAMRQLSEVAAKPFEAKGAYPSGDLGDRLREAARLVDSGLGLEVIQIDHGGFDTHQSQANSWAGLVTPLAQGLAAFFADIETRGRANDVLVLAVSEFGRTVRMNGTRGTDHGSAGCVLALGGAVRGEEGRPAKGVLGEWPTLAREALQDDRDLRMTTDIRDVYAEALGRFMGVPEAANVLPGWKPSPLGLFG
ncbi:MAG: DUF1501 domain-containing protein [Planctomycetota bacterium]